MKHYDVIIVGIGPAGAAAALSLADKGLRILMVDKSNFPRDKICGDALSPDVVNQLHMLPLDTGKVFDRMEKKLRCHAVRFVAPNHSSADLRLDGQQKCGYVSERLHFDQMLFDQVSRLSGVALKTGHRVTKCENGAEKATVELSDGSAYSADILLAADGAQSVVKRQLTGESTEMAHHCAGLRWYFENVSGFSADNAVELHFYKEFLPGYFWIFPLPNNRANVGVGMLSEFVGKRKIDLKERLQYLVHEHPNVRHRFKEAKPLENIKGFSLPLGSKKRNISGNRFLLLGDAASLINPLSGEGIGNAIRSGRVAGDHLVRCFEADRFDAAFNKSYDQEIYRRMWGELKANYYIQRIMRSEWICNFVVQHAIGNKFIQRQLLSGFTI